MGGGAVFTDENATSARPAPALARAVPARSASPLSHEQGDPRTGPLLRFGLVTSREAQSQIPRQKVGRKLRDCLK